jgi:hypothetical protein
MHLTRLLFSPGYPVGVDRRCQRGLLDGPWPHAGSGPAGTGDAGGSVDLDSGEDVEGKRADLRDRFDDLYRLLNPEAAAQARAERSPS